MTPTFPTAETTLPFGRLGYQPALDGVRAIAISLVVLYHYPWASRRYGINPLHGGFLGVDAFFVLSGYLITTLLLQEHRAFGSVSLRRFYARRALRLFPAFAVLWVIVLILHFRLGSPDPLRAEWPGLFSTLFYVGNWAYLADPQALGPLQHTWSLAIEEQFYLLWPAILIFALRKRLQLRTLAALTALGAFASAAYRAAYWRHANVHPNFGFFYFRITGRPQPVYRIPGGSGHLFTRETGSHLNAVWNRIYFGSDTQADALLAGCFTAILLVWLLPRLDARARRVLSVASGLAVAAAAFIVASAYSKSSAWMPEWGFLAYAVSIAVVIAGLVVAPSAPLARAFALPPLAWLGRRSYAIYLFHQLVFSQLKSARLHISPPAAFAVRIGAVLLAAEICYRLVEAPMLRLKRHVASNRITPPIDRVAAS